MNILEKAVVGVTRFVVNLSISLLPLWSPVTFSCLSSSWFALGSIRELICCTENAQWGKPKPPGHGQACVMVYVTSMYPHQWATRVGPSMEHLHTALITRSRPPCKQNDTLVVGYANNRVAAEKIYEFWIQWQHGLALLPRVENTRAVTTQGVSRWWIVCVDLFCYSMVSNIGLFVRFWFSQTTSLRIVIAVHCRLKPLIYFAVFLPFRRNGCQIMECHANQRHY